VLTGLVSHYRVVSPLGAGGMSVVYKAIDTRLNRPVAIKAIAEKHGLDTSATLRLRREALAAASLDHPYICKIYELLETDAGTLIVMEFVEGETLGVVLSRGVPALVDALRYGAEIAEGLANAHGRGLVHRDIKPSNIMVTPHGHVKLLDFGIVRAADLVLDGATRTYSALTQPGAVAGSPFYMSPEQALGFPVDGRSDLFSLGTVLFECLTGVLPFEGATRDAYVQAMLAGRVRPLEQLAPTVPPEVAKIVRQCLESERSRRLDSAATLATELGRAAGMLSGSGAFSAARRPSRTARIVQGALVVLTVLGLAGAYGLWRSSRGAADPTPRTMIAAVTWPSGESDPRVSPDGRWLSFLSNRDGSDRLFVQPVDGGTATLVDIVATEVVSHAWSPDGREIVCVVRQPRGTSLQVVPAFFGGLPRITIPIEPDPEDVRVLRWIGGEVFVAGNLGFAGHPLWRFTLSTGAREDLSKGWSITPAYRGGDISADGREIVFAARHEGQTDLWAVRTDGSGFHRLTNDAYIERNPVWIGNTGRIAFQSGQSGQLDLWEMAPGSGQPAQLTSSPTIEIPAGASPDGSVLAFEQAAESATLWALEGGRTRQLTSDALRDFWPSLSEDGSRLAFQRARTTVREGIQYFDSQILVASGNTAPASAQPQSVGDGFGARISPDGEWVAYLQRANDPSHMILQLRNIRTGEARTVWERCPPVGISGSLPIDWLEQHVVWSPRANELLFVGLREGGTFIGRSRIQPSAPVDVVVAPSGVVRDIRPSPDGRVLAYLVRASGGFALHALDLQTGSDSVIATEAAPDPFVFLRGWTAGGSLLLLRTHPGPTGSFEIAAIDVSTAGARRPIATFGDAFVTTSRLDAAGKRLLVTRAEAGIHNIYSLSLADGRLTRLSDNQLPGVSFTGIESASNGAIVYSRPESRRDIWIARRAAR
jgi:serine/threonine protein kinase/Tol biopolymer transport system component